MANLMKYLFPDIEIILRNLPELVLKIHDKELEADANDLETELEQVQKNKEARFYVFLKEVVVSKFGLSLLPSDWFSQVLAFYTGSRNLNPLKPFTRYHLKQYRQVIRNEDKTLQLPRYTFNDMSHLGNMEILGQVASEFTMNPSKDNLIISLILDKLKQHQREVGEGYNAVQAIRDIYLTLTGEFYVSYKRNKTLKRPQNITIFQLARYLNNVNTSKSFVVLHTEKTETANIKVYCKSCNNSLGLNETNPCQQCQRSLSKPDNIQESDLQSAMTGPCTIVHRKMRM